MVAIEVIVGIVVIVGIEVIVRIEPIVGIEAIASTVAVDVLATIGQTLLLSHLAVVFRALPALPDLALLLIFLPPFPQFPDTGVIKTNRHISSDILYGL